MDNHMEEVAIEKQDKGFTLVELLIVIVILGILATVTVFAVRGITDQGQTSACEADQKTLQTAIEAFYAQNGTAAVPTEADLIPDFMRTPSKYLTIQATDSAGPPAILAGSVIVDSAVTDNPCTGEIVAG